MSLGHMGAWLTVNRKCNFRCGWCYARDTKFSTDDMSLDLARKLVVFLMELGVRETVLIGGEPTIYPHLVEVIKLLQDCKITPFLVTNGKRFVDYDYAEQIVSSGIKHIAISLKGADADQYKELTKVDCYDDVIAGYDNLQKLGIEPTISITIVSDLIPRIEELLVNLDNAGISAITFDMGTPVIVGDSISAEGIQDPRQLAQSCSEIYSFMKRRNSRFNMRISVPLCLFPEDLRNEMITSNAIMTCCHIQSGSGVIFDQGGNLLPCNHFPSHPLGKFGVDFSDAESFRRFWSGDDLEAFRNVTRRYPSEKCESCSDWDKCGGGCFLEWLNFDPALFIR
ncbi:hypothetical protein COT97_04010 [Candidatus Falkowbacteria bacterium CG10_big_fil_rev_8_21_14_0_10_39_11]|uniref:Radical SAM core domain-containing protein n=1 Tax=Candidatus Falkowbacteria bacterium CG10_big_fil_rev_8_21_14_0_10_39_11 TaxID=1974565 RepID=A0A2H0V4E7_9BACT|nr:MAG: hypothetical protein COT97_04010 [Candidatus Falkowbacteria bacterium CG10_big_fil_rev_8_21_14_0_10_39_11]